MNAPQADGVLFMKRQRLGGKHSARVGIGHRISCDEDVAYVRLAWLLGRVKVIAVEPLGNRAVIQRGPGGPQFRSVQLTPLIEPAIGIGALIFYPSVPSILLGLGRAACVHGPPAGDYNPA